MVKGFRFVLGRRVFIVFLALMVAVVVFLQVPVMDQSLAVYFPLGDHVEMTIPTQLTVAHRLSIVPSKEGLLLSTGHGGTWTQVTGSATPAARAGHAIATTPSGLVLFGGLGNSYLNDTWRFDAIAMSWFSVSTSTKPSIRYQHAMADTPSGVLLFGGYRGSDTATYFNDTWLFNTTSNTWGRLTFTASSPSARRAHAMVATPSGVLLFGGGASNSMNLNDTWFFDFSTCSWTQLLTSPTPLARRAHAMAATPSGVLLFGGNGNSGLLNDTWLFDNATQSWSMLTSMTSSPAKREYQALTAMSSGVLLFGGIGTDNLNDTWLFDTTSSSWTQVETNTAFTPPVRRSHALAAIPSGVILFGGYNSSYLNDTWFFMSSTIRVTSPTTGATWSLGEMPTITWISTAVSGTCTVELSRNGGNSWETLTTTTATLGTNTWTVTGAASANCLVRVASKGASGSSGTFTITHTASPDSISLTPASATILAGTTTNYTLIAQDTSTNTWDVTSFGTYTISSGAEGTWSPTNTYTAGNAGQWTVTASFDSKSATAQLTVIATLHLSSPIGGEDWIHGHAYPITWTSTGVTGTTTIELSRDNGVTWETLTTTTATSSTFLWTVTTPRTFQALVKVSGSGQSDQSPVFFRLRDPQIGLLSPVGLELWAIGSRQAVTWTSTDLDSTTLTISLALDGVDFTETITHGLTSTSTHYTWTVTSPGTINAKIRVHQNAIESTSPEFIISRPYAFRDISTLTTIDPVLEIFGSSSTGTFWVIPLDPQYTSNPNLNRFIQETGKRPALFFDIGQEGFTPTTLFTVVLHYPPRLGEETFLLYCWDKSNTKWILMPGIPLSPNTVNHTFTFKVLASELTGTPFALGGDPAAMPGLSPWALALLSLLLLGAGSSWLLRERRLI
jgi:N-acetylneuraminic acid mutarotase